MKFIMTLLAITIIIVSLSGCKNNAGDVEVTEAIKTVVTPTDVIAPSEITTIPVHVPSGYTWEDLKKPTPDPEVPKDITSSTPVENGLVMETHYGDNIIFKMQQSEYPLDAEKISGNAIDTNPGVCYTFNLHPRLERYSDGKWVRLAYYPPGIFFEEQWMYTLSSEENEPDKGVAIRLAPKYVYEDLTPGRYRLVAFVGDGKYYAEFEFVE